MAFEKSKKSLLVIKLVTCIIINFLKLRELYSSVKSSTLIGHIGFIKDISNFGFDLLSLNIISMIINIVPCYRKLKKGYNYISEKFK